MSRRGGNTRIVAGVHPVRELLRAGAPVFQILIDAGRERSAEVDDLLALAAEAGVKVERVARGIIDADAEDQVHQGVIAHAPPFAYADLAEVLAASKVPFLVALDGVTDPHNLGSIARTAEAVGADAIIIPTRRAAGVTPTAEKAAAGALAHLPVVQVTNLVRGLGMARDAGCWILGLDTDNSVPIATSQLLAEPVVLVVGAEGPGLARLTRESCDQLVRLPMHGNVVSLNASVAAAIAMYEVERARSANVVTSP